MALLAMKIRVEYQREHIRSDNKTIDKLGTKRNRGVRVTEAPRHLFLSHIISKGE